MAKRKLKTEINTEAMGERILDTFEVSDHADRDGELTYQANFEHGHWWITCLETGGQWSVVDATGGDSIDGFDFELITAEP
jgi:hypothetical protein